MSMLRLPQNDFVLKEIPWNPNRVAMSKDPEKIKCCICGRETGEKTRVFLLGFGQLCSSCKKIKEQLEKEWKERARVLDEELEKNLERVRENKRYKCPKCERTHRNMDYHFGYCTDCQTSTEEVFDSLSDEIYDEHSEIQRKINELNKERCNDDVIRKKSLG
jgi:hypothetical protein